MKISVITPSIREGGLEINQRCLKRQTFKDFEWLVCSPYVVNGAIWIAEPTKRANENYNLNKCWNLLVKKAQGELLVSIVDLLWFPPDTLERLWSHYQADSHKCVGGVGHQYQSLVNGKPEGLIWKDPRLRNEMFYQTSPLHFELCVASLPRSGVLAVGGFDEEFDRYAALSEKELCFRLENQGYNFWIDQSLEYRALKHGRLTLDWDERYFQGTHYFETCLNQIKLGQRQRLDFLS